MRDINEFHLKLLAHALREQGAILFEAGDETLADELQARSGIINSIDIKLATVAPHIEGKPSFPVLL